MEREGIERLCLHGGVDENGYSFVLTKNGDIVFGEIIVETGIQAAPILLSVGFQSANGKGYGLRHIEANHGSQIRDAGFVSVVEFVEYVAKNYETIKIGNKRGINNTYLLEVEDKYNNTIFIEWSCLGYWNVNSAGVFNKRYSNKKKVIWTLPAVSNGADANTKEVNHG